MELRKLFVTLLAACLGAGSLVAQNEGEDGAGNEAEAKSMEIAEPPYEVGDLIMERGHYIEREGRTSINFRIEGSRIRIYWIDEEGRVAEPEASSGNVRFRGPVTGRPYHYLRPLSEGAGLGADGLIRKPFIFNVLLSLRKNGEGNMTSYGFRFTADLNEPREPEILREAENG